MKKRWLSLLILSFACAGQGSGAPPPPCVENPSVYTLLSTSPAVHSLFEHMQHQYQKDPQKMVALNGATELDQKFESRYDHDFEGKGKGKWFIENQRYGADLIEAGLTLKDADLVNAGTKALLWGLDRQGQDGDFPGTGDPFHSVSMFVSELGLALLAMKTNDDTVFLGRIQVDRFRLLQGLSRAAHWLLQEGVLKKGKKNDSPYTHRRWILAAALGQAAQLTGDAVLAAAADPFAQDGLSLQTANGINPEKDGYDVSYQMVGVLQAEQYYLTLPCDSPLRDQVKTMIVKALAWEMGRISPTGEVNAEGSTRVAVEKGRSGKIKKVNYKEVVEAFAFAAQITGDSSYADTAAKLAASPSK